MAQIILHVRRPFCNPANSVRVLRKLGAMPPTSENHPLISSFLLLHWTPEERDARMFLPPLRCHFLRTSDCFNIVGWVTERTSMPLIPLIHLENNH